MEELQKVLQGIIEKYGITKEDVAVINEALLNIESPEYQGAEAAQGEEFNDPYAAAAAEGEEE